MKKVYIGEKESVVRVQIFQRYLQDVGYSKSSWSMLPECVRDFLNHAEKSPDEITQKEITSFYVHLNERPHKRRAGGLSEQYISHHMYAIKTFFNYLEATGQIKHNPISMMKFKAAKVNTRSPLSGEEIRTLFEAAQTSKETAILHLFYSCGLRRSEAVRLNIRDLHFNKRLLYVREGKGKKRRAIPLARRVSEALERYREEERAREKEMEAFMINEAGARMRGDSYNKSLKAIINRTSIDRETSLHHLRHSIATHLLETGISLENVRDFLGHAHLESTQLYVKVTPSQIRGL